MRYCKHTQWLGLAVDNGDVLLQNTDRLQTILEDLPDPDEQSPSLFVFIGNSSKARAIRELAKTFSPPPRYGRGSSSDAQHVDDSSWRGQTSLNGRRAHGEIHLHVHAPSTFSSRPVLVAEGDLPSLDKLRVLAIEKCHETTTRLMNNRASNTASLPDFADRIYTRLLLPFTDVFCFFADDVGGLKHIVQRLALWLDLGQPSSLPTCTRPKVLVVISSTKAMRGSNGSVLRDFKQMLSEETPVDVSQQFSDISILSLPAHNNELSNKARHRELFEQLLNFSDQVREARDRTRTLFSAHHFAAFFQYALAHAAETSIEAFNFISASRIKDPVPIGLQDHLKDFLEHIKTPQELVSFAIPVIASSLLLDSYLPDTHFFDPQNVFCILYKDICRQISSTGILLADQGSTDHILPSDFARLLEDQFVSQVEVFSTLSNVTAAAWHLQTLSAFKHDWLKIHSFRTCFVCNLERPQYRLPCGHIIGNKCVRRNAARTDVWDFAIDHCFLCGLETPLIRFKFRPPTATPRLLSIDGGGVRGIIPLVILQVLEELIGLPYPVQGNFDFMYGTSSGGISTLALSHKGLSVEDAIALYERVAKRAFELHLSYLPLLSYLLSCLAILISLFTNGIYPTRNLNTALQAVFGNKTILDCSSATATGTYIGIVASTMKPEPFLFTNYNGIGDREHGKSGKYGVLQGDALVWEIARSTSAAPGFFTPWRIAGVGKFQDGGLGNKNPYKLAQEEIKASCRNDPLAKRASLKVSLGTGKAPDHEPEMYGSNSWWRDGWIIRLVRALWSSIDGQEDNEASRQKEASGHQDHLKNERKRRRGESFRINVEFETQPPRLDDWNKMPEMKCLTKEAIRDSKQLDRLAHCLIAEYFVFELESVPRRENGWYSCIGYIYCRHRAGSDAFEALLERLTRSSATFLLQGRTVPGSCRDRSSLARDGNFRKRMCFNVSSKQDLFSIHLREKGSESYNISGSPFSLNWLIESLGMDRPFGRSDGENEEGSCKKRPRLL